MSCILGLNICWISSDFLERPSPPETVIKEQLLNLISAERVSYFLLYYTGKMDTKHLMKDHSWIWKKLLLITWLSKIWCILHLWIETLILYIYTSIYLLGCQMLNFYVLQKCGFPLFLYECIAINKSRLRLLMKG